MLFTDIQELRTMLDIPQTNTAEDVKLNFLNEYVAVWIEEILDRKLFYKSRTEYYNGTGTQKLLLRARPVFTTPTIQVYVDENGNFGSTSGSFSDALTYGTDFCLQIDQEDGSSRSGILIRINKVWPRPFGRQPGLLTPFLGQDLGSIKVTYTAGFTVDSLPGLIRQAADLLVSRLFYILPLGMELGSESYEERAISLITPQKSYLTALVKPMLIPYYKNWTF